MTGHYRHLSRSILLPPASAWRWARRPRGSWFCGGS